MTFPFGSWRTTSVSKIPISDGGSILKLISRPKMAIPESRPTTDVLKTQSNISNPELLTRIN